jgi:hypothetical protein
MTLLSKRSPWSRRWVSRRRMGMVPWAIGNFRHRWEELHTLASEPREQHVLLAEQVEDATNGFLSTLGSSNLCTPAAPGRMALLRR